MKIQLLVSKKSWATKKLSLIKKILLKFDKKIKIINNHKNLKNKYDVNIIFSYFKIIEKKYLKRSKKNIVIHASDLPHGRGMSPLTWQILKGKTKIIFSLIEVNEKIDEGEIYYKRKVNIPNNILFDEIKKIQFNVSLKFISRFLGQYKKTKKFPKSFKQVGKTHYFKRRSAIDSKLDINKSLKSQFNLLRVCDSENYPSYFIFNKKKFKLKIYDE